ncbi:MAG: hypothetical protein RLZZ387_991 [Chloroflexota bacterium]
MPAIDLAPNSPYGLRLNSPVMTAAGCFGYGVEYARGVPLNRIGAVVTRSVTLHGRRPKQPPRLVETPAGLLCVGVWRDPGLERVLDRHLDTWMSWKTPVVLSVAGDYAEVAVALETVDGIAALELRLDDPATAAEIVAEVRGLSLLPLLAKLPPHDALVQTAQAVAAAGADALTILGPPRALAVDPRTGERLDGTLCGPAIRPLAMRAVAEVCAAVSVPVVACGGVRTSQDARQMIALGATAVQVGSALLSDPLAAMRVADALEALG